MNKDFPETGASGIPRENPDTPPTDPASTHRTEPSASPPKSKGGAPRGNVNGAKDPDFSRAMRTLREQAAAGRSATSRKALAAGQKITRELGAGDAALGDRVARRLADRELLLDLCRGRIKRAAALRSGEPSPWVAMFSKALDDDLSDLRALLARFLDSAQTKAARLVATGPLLIVDEKEYRGGDNCPTCSRPIPRRIVSVTAGPEIALTALDAGNGAASATTAPAPESESSDTPSIEPRAPIQFPAQPSTSPAGNESAKSRRNWAAPDRDPRTWTF